MWAANQLQHNDNDLLSCCTLRKQAEVSSKIGKQTAYIPIIKKTELLKMSVHKQDGNHHEKCIKHSYLHSINQVN